jgi:hypothetical protein
MHIGPFGGSGPAEASSSSSGPAPPPPPGGGGGGAACLTRRECSTALLMALYLAQQAKRVQDIDGQTRSFQPHMPPRVAKCITDICASVTSLVKKNPIYAKEMAAGLRVLCPICEGVLLKIDISLVYDEALTRCMHCTNCSIDVDTCFFTLLPSDPCNIDADDTDAEVTAPLKCSVCLLCSNTTRRNHKLVGDSSRKSKLEYIWLPTNMGSNNSLCPYCSIPLLPTYCYSKLF